MNKGNTAEKGMILDTINVILYVPQAEIYFLLTFFECVWVFLLWESVC